MLVGKRVRLRPVELEDLSLLVDWRNTPAIWNGFFNKFPLSRAGQQTWLAKLVADQGKLLFMICLVQEGEPIGTIGLDQIDFANQCCEFGNMLIGQQNATGQGYATEAIQLISAYGFLRLNMNRVYLRVYADNTRAIRLYERCGFKTEGTLREAHFENGMFKDLLIMSILRREFIKS